MESFLTPYGLSNSGQEKLQFTPFWGGPKPGSSDGLCTGTIESHNFFCLRSYPGEISYSNSPNRGLSNDISDVVVRRRKVALHTSSHLTPTEAWRSPDFNWWKDLLFLTFMTNVINKIHKDKWSERMRQFYSNTFRRITPSSVRRLIELNVEAHSARMSKTWFRHFGGS